MKQQDITKKKHQSLKPQEMGSKEQGTWATSPKKARSERSKRMFSK